MTVESAVALAVGFDSQPLPSMIADQKTLPKSCIGGKSTRYIFLMLSSVLERL